MVDRLRVGVAGLHRGPSFIRTFTTFKETEVTAICDVNQDTLNKVGGSLGIKGRYLDYEDMLASGVEVAVVATPMQFHAPQAISALKSNIHVLSEVTAAISLDECHLLLQAARASRAKYMMAENYCYTKSNVLVRNMVRQGLFGEVYFAEGEYVHDVKSLHHDERGKPTWRYYWQVGRNGCTYGTHSLGPVLQWFDERVVTVSCLGSGRHTDPEHLMDDTVLMLCKTESGALIKIRLDMLSNRPHNMAYYSLQGTRGCYEAPRGLGDDHKVWLAGFSGDPNKWRPLSDLEEQYLPDIWRKPPEEALKAGHWGGDYFVARDFLDSILNDTKPPIDIYDALNFTAPGLVSEESIKQGGKPLPVPDFREL
ncbi:MAG: Gfo/Idh/MocA family oxidoreductase [Candidatus Bathyarchaeia archaeon]